MYQVERNSYGGVMVDRGNSAGQARVMVIQTGKATGPTGPPGADIVAVPYLDWPPVDPEPNTLYLRLEP